MAGREVKGFVVTPAMALFLAGLVAAVIGYQYRTLMAEHDTLIRLETKFDERSARDAEYRHATKNILDLQQVYINNMDKQITIMKSLLTPSQQKLLQQHKTEN